MIQDPDAGLVQEAQNGDKAAFGKLVNQHYEMVYAIAYGILNNRESALDVAQEVFLKTFRTLENFEGKSKFKTWLHRVAVNAAIDQTRKKRPTESIDINPEDEETEGQMPVIVKDEGPGPRDRAAQAELKGIFAKGLTQLSAEHRAVLVLREWQGLSYEEIAETLHLELGTVMSRLFYARKKLGEILGNRFDKEVS